MPRALVTGGAGFIGGALARRLASAGYEVVILDSLLPQVHGQAGPDALAADLVHADVRDQTAVRKAMEGIDVVHHLAAETGVGQSQYELARYVGTNAHGTAVVLQAAAEVGVGQVVITSSRAVYGEGRQRCSGCSRVFAPEARRVAVLDAGRWEAPCPRCGAAGVAEPTPESSPPAPTSVYGLTKLHQEQLAATVSATHGLPVTVLRLFNVFGPGQSMTNPYVGVLGTFFRHARAGRPVEVYEDGLMLRDFVFVDDVVEVLARVTANPGAFGRTWNVGAGEAVTLLDVAKEMFDAMGLEPRFSVSGRYRVGDVRHAVADVSRLDAELGYRPSTPFAEGLRQFVAWAAATGGHADDDGAAEQLEARRLLRGGGR